MVMLKIFSLAVLVSAVVANPVDPSEFSARGISSSSNKWNSFAKKSDTSKDKESYDANTAKYSQEKSTEVPTQKIFFYQNGELEKSDPSELSKVIGSKGYSKEVIYHGVKKTSDEENNSSGSGNKNILGLLPIEESEKPQRVVIYRKKSSFVRLVEGLYDIVTDIFYIVSYSSSLPKATEKSDIAQRKDDLWPLLRNVLHKYFALIKESELLNGLEDVLPVNEIEEALERGDGKTVWKTIYGSFTPKLMSYAVKMMAEAFFAPLQVFQGQYSQLEVRQQADGTFNVLETIKFFADAALSFISSQLRGYGPVVARSLSCTFYYDCEGEGRSLTEMLPYGVAAAGVGGAAYSAYYLYNSVYSEAPALDDYGRQKRSVFEEKSLPPTDINEIIDSIGEGDFLVMDSDPISQVSYKSELGRKLVSKDSAKKMLMTKLDSLVQLSHPIASA